MKMKYLFISVLVYSVSFSQPQEKVRGITVTGVGVVSVLPDRVELYGHISQQDEKVNKALELSNIILHRVLDSLRTLGIPDSDIATTSFQVQRQVVYVEDNKTRGVYVSSHSLKIQLAQISRVGEIIDKLATNGVTGIYPPVFSYADETLLKNQGYEKAIMDATSKAEKLAESFGVKLGKPLQIAVDMYDVQPKRYYYHFDENTNPMTTSSVSTVIMPNYVTKQVKVDVTFEILNPDKK